MILAKMLPLGLMVTALALTGCTPTASPPAADVKKTSC